MKVLIVTGGDVDKASAAGFLKGWGPDFVIAVDGGLLAAEELALFPDCIVGDFDTIEPKRLAPYRKRGVHFETHKPEKDYTDTELALFYGLSLEGVTEITILGGLGRRFDHALANLQILLHGLKKDVFCRMVDAYNCIYLLERPKTLKRSETWGKYISLIPFTEKVSGVTLEGFKYPLLEAVLVQGNSLGISNELTEETGTIRIREGIAVCVESRD